MEVMLEGRYYDLKNERDALLQGMALSEDVYGQPPDKKLLLAHGFPLSDDIIDGFIRSGIKKIKAHHLFAKKIYKSINEVEKMLHAIDDITNLLPSDALSKFNSAKEMIEDQIKEALDFFSQDAIDALSGLIGHHSKSAVHSINAGCNMMVIGSELGWEKGKIVRGVMAAFLHDVGKKSVNVPMLEKRFEYDDIEEAGFQRHTLEGYRVLLAANQGKIKEDAIAALTHHEWYIKSKEGFGGLSLFRDELCAENNVHNLNSYLKKCGQDQLDLIHAMILVDAVTTLEEVNSDKGKIPYIKIMSIMTKNAQDGRFNPEHFTAWHRYYLKKRYDMFYTPDYASSTTQKDSTSSDSRTEGQSKVTDGQTLLKESEGRKFSYPVEMEKIRLIAKTKEINPPRNILTISELNKIKKLEKVANLGFEMARCDARGGISLDEINERCPKEEKITDSFLLEKGIVKEKNILIIKDTYLEVIVSVDVVTSKDLNANNLFSKLEKKYSIYKDNKIDDISIFRIANNYVNLNSGIDVFQEVNNLKEYFSKHKIKISRQYTILLPYFEKRLNFDDLIKLDQEEKVKSLSDELKSNKRRSVSFDQLRRHGFLIPKDSEPKKMMAYLESLRRKGIIVEKKVLYDMKIEKIFSNGKNTAYISFFREGIEEKIKFVSREKGSNMLYPLIGDKNDWQETFEIFELDFTKYIELPKNLSRVKQGDHWSFQCGDKPEKEYEYDVFISYSHEDQDIIKYLFTRLQDENLNVWLDSEEIRRGNLVARKISEGIDKSRIGLLTLSSYSVAADWPVREREAFSVRDPTNKRDSFIYIKLEEIDFPDANIFSCVRYYGENEDIEKEFQTLLRLIKRRNK
ncbi:MAG: TIR domain-containing protein [Magnetococcales bacterium]|nr:TIR domain-containing protein [Magnetococcales bacterium]MBF0322100.1 TIR domain-containing protein [Magnetococcales bacterium]